MFPLNSNQAYIKDTGERTTLGKVIGSGGGGGGGSLTPDYDNNRLEIGTHEGFDYYIPMSKEPAGGFDGYEIKTNPASDQYDAMIDIYHYADIDGNAYTELIKTIHHDASKGDTTYNDDNISVSYQSGWKVVSNATLYKTNGDAYANPLTWTYSTTVDYVMLFESPV